MLRVSIFKAPYPARAPLRKKAVTWAEPFVCRNLYHTVPVCTSSLQRCKEGETYARRKSYPRFT